MSVVEEEKGSKSNVKTSLQSGSLPLASKTSQQNDMTTWHLDSIVPKTGSLDEKTLQQNEEETTLVEKSPSHGGGSHEVVESGSTGSKPMEPLLSQQNFHDYVWNEGHWDRILGSSCPDDVWQRDVLDIRCHIDPISVKCGLNPEYVIKIPTGGRSPNREALKKLRREMEKRGEIPKRRRRHHEKGQPRGEQKGGQESKFLKSQSSLISALTTPTKGAISSQRSVTIAKGSREYQSRKSKRDTKSTETSIQIALAASVTGAIMCPPLRVVNVTHHIVGLAWSEVFEEEEEGAAEEDEKEEEEKKEGEEEKEGEKLGEAGKPPGEKSPVDKAPVEEPPVEKQKEPALLGERFRQSGVTNKSILSEREGDSRMIYFLQMRPRDSAKDWTTIHTGYGLLFECKDLKPKTTYLFRLRMTDHERGIHSLWSEEVEVQTCRLPYTVQDVFQKVGLDDVEGAIEILDTGEVDPNSEDSVGFSPLMRAAQRDKIKMMQMLLRHGADPNFQSKEQRRSALMVACYSGNWQAVKCLRLFEAKYELFDSSHLYAIHWVVDGGNMDLMDYILADGANIEVVDNQGWTPLHRCGLVGAKTEGICEVLLRYEAKIDKVDKDMKTALMLATISNKGNIAGILLSRGADIFVQNKDGRTVYDLAAALERRGITMLLEDIAKNMGKETSVLHGPGLKGGPAVIDAEEFQYLDRMARQLGQKLRKKTSF